MNRPKDQPCYFYDDINHEEPICICSQHRARCKGALERCDLAGGKAEVYSIDEFHSKGGKQ